MSTSAPTLSLPTPVPPHPRLMASAEDFARLSSQIRSDDVSGKIFGCLKKQADLLLAEPPVERVMTGRRLLHVSRKALWRISVLAMVARLTGDAIYSRRAIAEALAACSFTDWNPDHFLDTAEMSLAVAIVYDWLYEDLTEAQRNQIATGLFEKGIQPALDPQPFWVTAGNNWNQVCHAGMSAAAVAIADLYPEAAELTLRRAVENIHYSAKAYGPDGAYPEGPTYWSYGTTFHVILADIFQKFYGDTRGLDDYAGFRESADYITQVTAPSGDVFNYSDCRAARGLALPFFWMARQYQRPEWLRFDISKLSHYLSIYEEDKLGEHYRVLALILLWWEPKTSELPAPACVWHARGKGSVSAFRTSHDDPAALYAAMKGGGPSLSHAHMDAGTFILEADGVRWASDLGMQDYETLESIGVNMWNAEPGGTRWKVFRIGADSHNILRFNRGQQAVPGIAVPLGFRAEGDPACVYDLSSLYPEMKSVTRGMSMLSGKAILFQDEWEASTEGVEASWQMVTFASVKMEGRNALLSKDGKTLRLEVLEPSDAKIEVVDAETLRQPYDAENLGASILSITTKTEAGARGSFRLLAIPGSTQDITAPERKALREWIS